MGVWEFRKVSGGSRRFEGGFNGHFRGVYRLRVVSLRRAGALKEVLGTSGDPKMIQVGFKGRFNALQVIQVVFAMFQRHLRAI